MKKKSRPNYRCYILIYNALLPYAVCNIQHNIVAGTGNNTKISSITIYYNLKVIYGHHVLLWTATFFDTDCRTHTNTQTNLDGQCVANLASTGVHSSHRLYAIKRRRILDLFFILLEHGEPYSKNRTYNTFKIT